MQWDSKNTLVIAYLAPPSLSLSLSHSQACTHSEMRKHTKKFPDKNKNNKKKFFAKLFIHRSVEGTPTSNKRTGLKIKFINKQALN